MKGASSDDLDPILLISPPVLSDSPLYPPCFPLRDTLAQDGKITAVLDWLHASYSDFVYDIAVLDFWWPWLGVREAFQEYSQQRELPFYAERLLCHECHHALGALRFFAKSGHEAGYRLTRTLILHKLDVFAN